jgi:hypothetical protein
MRRVLSLFAVPGKDTLRGLDRCLDRGMKGLFLIALGLAAGWWVYVPLHELLHAAACAAAGGSVTRLEIDVLYGGGLLARLLPFVAPASDYAGRLSGFDTHGSDAIYLATDLAPFLLTLWPGVWWLRRAGSRRWPVAFGASLPFALAPFLSLTGDAYEIGSLLVTRIAPWSAAPLRALLRGDDLFLRIQALRELGAEASPPWGGLLSALAVGVGWAFLTYAAGGWISRRLGQAPTEAR